MLLGYRVLCVPGRHSPSHDGSATLGKLQAWAASSTVPGRSVSARLDEVVRRLSHSSRCPSRSIGFLLLALQGDDPDALSSASDPRSVRILDPARPHSLARVPTRRQRPSEVAALPVSSDQPQRQTKHTTWQQTEGNPIFQRLDDDRGKEGAKRVRINGLGGVYKCPRISRAPPPRASPALDSPAPCYHPSMSLKHKDFLEAAADALMEAQESALASIGERGTYARKKARAAALAYHRRRWERICARVQSAHQPVDPTELSRSFYLDGPPTRVKLEKP